MLLVHLYGGVGKVGLKEGERGSVRRGKMRGAGSGDKGELRMLSGCGKTEGERRERKERKGSPERRWG